MTKLGRVELKSPEKPAFSAEADAPTFYDAGLTSERIRNVRAWSHQPYSPERFAALLDDHAARTGERLPLDSAILDYVPLMREPYAGVDDQNHAVWLLATADGESRMLIEHPGSDSPAVDVVLRKLADYNAAHRQLVQLMICATKHNRANMKNAKEREAGLLSRLRQAADRDVDVAVLVKRDVSIALDD